MMRKPLLATDSIQIEHRAGGAIFTFELTGVSCHEAHGVTVESPGFQRQSVTGVSIFPRWSWVEPCAAAAGDAYIPPAEFTANSSSALWTMAKEDVVTLPSGAKGRITRIEDSRAGRCSHWYIEVT